MRANLKATAVGLALAALTVLAALPWPIEPETLTSELTRDGPAPGFSWRVAAKASLAILPRPTLRLTMPEIVDSDGKATLHARKAVVQLSPGALLFGRFIATSVQLIDADIGVGPDVIARAADAGWVRKLARGRLELVRANISWKGSATQEPTVFKNVDGWIDWPGPDLSARYALKGLWKDEVVQSHGEIEAPASLLAGSTSSTSLTLSTAPLDVTLSGAWTLGRAPGFVGDIKVSARDPGAIATLTGWTGFPLPAGPSEASGQFDASPAEFSLSPGHFQLGSQSFDGSAQLRRDAGRWRASATLAADRLDIGAVIGAPPRLVDDYGLWRSDLGIYKPDPQIDYDLRLSAGSVVWGLAELSDVAATLTQDRGALQFNLIDAKAYEGVLAGMLTLSDCETRCREHATFGLNGARSDLLLAALGFKTAISGRGSISVDMRASGVSLCDILASASGSTDASMQEGSISGLNFEEALRRSQRRAVDPARDMAAGDSHFSSAHVSLAFKDGQGEIAQARIESPAAVAVAEGSVDLFHRDIRARISTRQVGPEGAPSPDAARLSFSLTGPWGLPSLTALQGDD